MDSMRDFLNYLINNKMRIPKTLDDTIEKILNKDELDEEVADLIESVWKNKKIKRKYEEVETQLQIPSSSPYYWEEASRFAKEDFLPSKEDILRAKIRTQGIIEIKFEFNDVLFNFLDVGGQRCERRKWLHCFDNCFAVIFITAINEYDGKVLEENDQVDRLEESLNLFERLVQSMTFHETPFILFMNKRDLFEEKLKHVPFEGLEERYPDYAEFKKGLLEEEGISENVEIGLNYLGKKFKDKSPSKQLYVYDTNALDESQCEKVFQSLSSSILEKSLAASFNQ